MENEQNEQNEQKEQESTLLGLRSPMQPEKPKRDIPTYYSFQAWSAGIQNYQPGDETFVLPAGVYRDFDKLAFKQIIFNSFEGPKDEDDGPVAKNPIIKAQQALKKKDQKKNQNKDQNKDQKKNQKKDQNSPYKIKIERDFTDPVPDRIPKKKRNKGNLQPGTPIEKDLINKEKDQKQEIGSSQLNNKDAKTNTNEIINNNETGTSKNDKKDKKGKTLKRNQHTRDTVLSSPEKEVKSESLFGKFSRRKQYVKKEKVDENNPKKEKSKRELEAEKAAEEKQYLEDQRDYESLLDRLPNYNWFWQQQLFTNTPEDVEDESADYERQFCRYFNLGNTAPPKLKGLAWPGVRDPSVIRSIPSPRAGRPSIKRRFHWYKKDPILKLKKTESQKTVPTKQNKKKKSGSQKTIQIRQNKKK